MRSMDDINRSLEARSQALERRIASRNSVDGTRYVETKISSPDTDKTHNLESVSSFKGFVIRRTIRAPYVKPHRISVTAGFVGSLVYLTGVIAICISLCGGDKCGMSSIWDVLFNMGLCGVFQSVVYFKAIGESFFDALGSMSVEAWLGFVLCIFIVLLLSAIFGPVIFAMNCSTFVIEMARRQNGKMSPLAKLLVAGIVVGTIMGTLAVGVWVSERLSAIDAQRQHMQSMNN